MKHPRITALCLATFAAAGAYGAVAQVPPESGTSMPKSGQADPIANEGVIEDNAVQALRDMGPGGGASYRP